MKIIITDHLSLILFRVVWLSETFTGQTRAIKGFLGTDSSVNMENP